MGPQIVVSVGLEEARVGARVQQGTCGLHRDGHTCDTRLGCSALAAGLGLIWRSSGAEVKTAW